MVAVMLPAMMPSATMSAVLATAAMMATAMVTATAATMTATAAMSATAAFAGEGVRGADRGRLRRR